MTAALQALSAIALAILCALAPTRACSQPPAGYRLVWKDEFNGTGLPSRRNWAYDTFANPTGWYNEELQYYAANRLANARVSGGSLHITARKERLSSAPDYGGQSYTSARLVTNGKRAWTYGFFEVRAKLPCGQGLWPAIWMLGSADNWPDSGEIDIMEKINSERVVHSTVHNRSTFGTSGSTGSMRVPTTCSAFHLYQMTWTSQAISFAVDGRIFHTYTKDGTGTDQWPFDAPQYLILNLAVGGTWPGSPDDRIFPKEMLIDYVRVYTKP